MIFGKTFLYNLGVKNQVNNKTITKLVFYLYSYDMNQIRKKKLCLYNNIIKY